MTPAGFPHSDTHGSMPAYGSPWLFAVCCVLRRLPAPRHPPCALCSLTIFFRVWSVEFEVWSYNSSLFAYGALTLCGAPSHALLLSFVIHVTVRTPGILLPPVWPLPISLATTFGISVDFFSSPYLDVSVQAVPRIRLCIQRMLTGYCPAGFPHSEIRGYYGCFRLPAAYRRLLRPSSAPGAKAFSSCPL